MTEAVEATRTQFTREQWFSLPLPLRARWWSETNYGAKMPGQELMDEIKRAFDAH